jgi:nucleotide-binding universal stress UspA family protein
MLPERPTVFERILVATDFSEIGERALDEALLLASERPSAALHVVYVAGSAGENVELVRPDSSEVMSAAEAVEHLERHVEKARLRAIRGGEPIESERVSVHVRAGISEDEIVRLSQDLNASLVVMGTHGRTGLRALVLGSVAESVMRKATAPVLVVRPTTHGAGGD